MSLSIQFDGLDELQADLARASDETRKGVAREITRTALAINADVKKRIQRGPKTGRTYRKSETVTHTASAPGQAPATDTGFLASSPYYEQSSPLSATVGSRLAYAYFLEFGTRTIAARPSWVPAIEAERPKFDARVDAILRSAFDDRR